MPPGHQANGAFPRLVVGDWASGELCATSIRRRQSNSCWNHKIVNVLAKLPKRQQGPSYCCYYPLRADSDLSRTVFTRWCGDHSYEAASEALERDWDRMVNFYDFPKEHWGHLRTTNPVESPCEASDRCRQALQEGRSGDSGDLENVDGRRTALQASEGP